MKFFGITAAAKLVEGDVVLWEKNVLSYLNVQVEQQLSSHIMSHRVNAIRKFLHEKQDQEP